MINIKIPENEYIQKKLNSKSKLLKNIDDFISKRTITEIDKQNYSYKRRNREYIRKIAVIRFSKGDILDLRIYKTKYGNNEHSRSYVSVYTNKKWKWLGKTDDKTICELIEQLIDKLQSLKNELENKVNNELKNKYGRIYISRG